MGVSVTTPSTYAERHVAIPVYEQSMSLIFLQDVSNVMQDMHVHISASASSVAMGNGKIESEDLLSQQERQSSIHVAGLKVGCNMFKVVPLSAVCIHIMQHVPHRSTHNKHYFCLAYTGRTIEFPICPVQGNVTFLAENL